MFVGRSRMLQLQQWLTQQRPQSWKSHTRQLQWLQRRRPMLRLLHLRPELLRPEHCMCLHASSCQCGREAYLLRHCQLTGELWDATLPGM